MSEPASSPFPAPPAVARGVFGARLPLAERYAAWLVGAGVERGLIGPHEGERLWERHLLNCVAAAALIPMGSSVVDLGSGAGLPGIVLAIARPDLTITLVESMLRRTAFLEVVVADLGLSGVQVRRARAEELKKPRLQADVVSARAVAPVDRLVALAAPLLRPGGQLLALKGAGVVEEVSSGWASARRAGMVDDAALLTVRPTGAPADVIRAGDHSPETSYLPGVEVVRVVTWATDGTAAPHAHATDSVVPDADGLALILRLRRVQPGSHRSPSLV
ncbi:MAG: rRNA (guanine527-N7)-methyltransferase [Actinomycetota bacterium]|nr:rRNA (guanine527-N7)-methyltransferase [Actinomycetota bacterium]